MTTPRDVLVIDDEQVITLVVVRVCAAEGLRVDAAEGAAGAWELLARHSYRLIVCDAMMPDVDGFQFLAELLRRGIRTPVIMSTGMATVENAVMALHAGAIDFIAKPFTADELLTVVSRGLSHDALQQAAPAGGGLAPRAACPEGYLCLGSHGWVLMDDSGSALVGVAEPFLKTVAPIAAVLLASVDDEVVQGSCSVTIRSGDGLAHGVLSPVSGRIVDVNGALASTPSLLESDPYARGWCYRVLPTSWEHDLRYLRPFIGGPP